jgi:NUMOD4 motif-containing protein/HNH endonuclease
MDEVWKAIPEHDGYEASDLGRLRSVDRWIVEQNGKRRFHRGRVLAQCINGMGYPFVGGLGAVHPLVMLAFKGLPPDGQEVAHNDGVKANCRLSNLRYDTPSGNAMDRAKHGTHSRGSRAWGVKLTEADVLAIRAAHGDQRAIGNRFGVSDTCVRDIKRGRRWNWLHGAQNPQKVGRPQALD